MCERCLSSAASRVRIPHCKCPMVGLAAPLSGGFTACVYVCVWGLCVCVCFFVLFFVCVSCCGCISVLAVLAHTFLSFAQF